MLPFIELKTQYQRLKSNIDGRIQAVLDHGQFIMGPEVQELEERLADYVGVRHCIGVASGTDALLIALMALGVGRGDEVVTTPFTFIATGETIALLGAKPVFIDIDPRTYNLDPNLLEAAITKRTRAIVPVSLFGQCADFDVINAIAIRHGVHVVEDGAQSLGATYKGRQSCSLADIGCTSFFPSKPLGGYGDAGALFTNDDSLALATRRIRTHGQDSRYHHSVVGVNGRLDTLQAAILLAKLETFRADVVARARIGNRYTELLHEIVETPYIQPENSSVYAQYTIQVNNRAQTQACLRERGIPTAVHYPLPLNRQPALDDPTCHVPNAERASSRVMSLPMHPYLNEKDQDRVCQGIRDCVGLALPLGENHIV